MKRLSAVIILLCAAIPASAQMYKWVDSNGKVHYSDSPPPRGTAAETMRTPARTATTTDGKSDAPKDSAKTGPKTAAEQELDFRKRRQDAAKTQADTDKKAAEARNKEENCKRAKAMGVIS